MSFWAAVVKKVGIGGVFMIVTAIASDFLGLSGDFDIKAFILKFQNFFLGVFAGLIVAGITKNWYVGFAAALLVIFVMYTVVGT